MPQGSGIVPQRQRDNIVWINGSPIPTARYLDFQQYRSFSGYMKLRQDLHREPTSISQFYAHNRWRLLYPEFNFLIQYLQSPKKSIIKYIINSFNKYLRKKRQGNNQDRQAESSVDPELGLLHDEQIIKKIKEHVNKNITENKKDKYQELLQDALYIGIPLLSSFILFALFLWFTYRAIFIIATNQLRSGQHWVNHTNTFILLFGSLSGFLMTFTSAIRNTDAKWQELDKEHKDIEEQYNDYIEVVQDYMYPQVKKYAFFALAELIYDINTNIKCSNIVGCRSCGNIITKINQKILEINKQLDSLNLAKSENKLSLNILGINSNSQNKQQVLEYFYKIIYSNYFSQIWDEVIFLMSEQFRAHNTLSVPSCPIDFVDNFIDKLDGSREAYKENHQQIIKAILYEIAKIASIPKNHVRSGLFAPIHLTGKAINNPPLQAALNAYRSSDILKSEISEPFEIVMPTLITDIFNNLKKIDCPHRHLFFKPISRTPTPIPAPIPSRLIPTPPPAPPPPTTPPPPLAVILPTTAASTLQSQPGYIAHQATATSETRIIQMTAHIIPKESNPFTSI